MRVTVTVKTSAKEEKVSKNGDGSLTVSVKIAPVEGKANVAVAKVLAQYFQVSPSCVTLYRGQKSKQKVFDILGL